MKRFSEEEYHLPFFDENDYIRRICPRCGEYFWTQNPDQTLCGESNAAGCSEYKFIDNPPIRKSYSLREMREKFLSFFEKNDHERVRPYPIVARWRDDLYFTNASIIDFQPYVTEGLIPPPANPLVISQPCVRFLDVDNVGPTFGRHLTIFEMGGHHAFNSSEKEVYWKDETVRFHHEFVTEELGVKSEEVIYKEGVWSGGGNAGPDVESIINGLEVATLVFMKYKVVGGEFVELPIRTVDTGYGIERFTWLSKGSVSCFHAAYDRLLDKIFDIAGIGRVEDKILIEASRLSGMMESSRLHSKGWIWKRISERTGVDYEEVESILSPVLGAFAIADHTKCIAFLLAEGIVPSNVREGYFARLIIRRAYRILRSLSIENRIADIVDMQIDYWSNDFPHLKDMRDEIIDILLIEVEKFKRTLSRGSTLIKRKIKELKSEGAAEFPVEALIELYDSHGILPESVKDVAEKAGVRTVIPENFYGLIAERHLQPSQTSEEAVQSELDEKVKDLPETRMLYYEDPYLSDFKAKILKVLGDAVILDQTAFYPEGGGQPADHGYLEFNGGRVRVVNVEKHGKVIVHFVDGSIPEGLEVRGVIDWSRRISLMRHHTATHIINAAARHVLGEHVWQAGAQKEVDRSRLDISHYKRLSLSEVHKIERLANEIVCMNLPVEVMWAPREEAERRYGFRLYQGGVVPGREIRIVKIGDWDVEACGGTHCKSTGEVGMIKIIRTERIQDGVERLIFAAGPSALKRIQEYESKLYRISEMMEVPVEKVDRSLHNLISEFKVLRKDRENLIGKVASYEAERYLAEASVINGLKVIIKIVGDAGIDQMIKVADNIVKLEPKAVVALFKVDGNVRIIVMVGEDARRRGLRADEIVREASVKVGGGGSGRPDFAQGGGSLTNNMEEAISEIKRFIIKKIG